MNDKILAIALAALGAVQLAGIILVLEGWDRTGLAALALGGITMITVLDQTLPPSGDRREIDQAAALIGAGLIVAMLGQTLGAVALMCCGYFMFKRHLTPRLAAAEAAIAS